jgi:4-oxalomesaconate hydratase
MKIMVIGAHPADGVDLAGATAYLHHCNGDKIIGVTLTLGMYSHTASLEVGKDFATAVEWRKAEAIKIFEFEKAWDILGANMTHAAGLRDEPLLMNQEGILSLVKLIREHRPDIVITHHPNEFAHWDHAECGRMVCRALKAAMKLPGEKHWVKTVYFFGVQFRPEVARVGVAPQPPDVLVDISGCVQAKVDALCCFESQGHNDQKMWERMNSMEREMGRADGLEYAEGFILYYPLKARLLPGNEVGGFY